jgi:hypothetical protein
MTMWHGGFGALLSWWQTANSYLGFTGQSRSHPSVSSGVELKQKKNITKELTDNSTDTKTLSLPLQYNSTTKSNDSKSTLWRSWANRNILNFTSRDDSEMQSTMNNTVDEEDGLPLRNGARMGTQPTGNSAVTNNPNFMDQSFDLVIQNNETYRDPWDDLQRHYSQHR